jgi:glycosyltransferase involved in cell wall biosynthesis
MRVLMINALYPPDRTGSAIFSDQLARCLQEDGVDVEVVSTSRVLEDDVEPSPVLVHRLPARQVSVGRIAWDYSIPIALGFSNLRRLRSIIRSFDPDVIHCHGQIFDLTWLASLAARLESRKLVVTVHTAIWHERFLPRFVLRVFEALVINPLIKLGRPTFIAVDKWTFNDAKRRIARKQTPQVIPVSIDAKSLLGGDATTAREKYVLGTGPILLSLGHVIALRNRVALVEALPRVLERIPNLMLVVVGDVRDREFLERATQLRIEKSILCLGSVPHSDIKHLLAASLVEAHDLQGLGLGITTVEAMASGVPIVAFATDDNYPGISLRSFDGLNFLDDGDPKKIAEAVISLTQNPEARDRAIQAQRNLISEVFDQQAVMRRHLDIYRSAIG